MRHYTLSLILVCWLLITVDSFAQIKHSQTEHISLASFQKNKQNFPLARFKNHYFLKLGFSEKLEASHLNQLKEMGVILLGKKDSRTYYVALPDNFPGRRIQHLPDLSLKVPQIKEKIAPSILEEKFPDWAVPDQDRLDVVIIFQDLINDWEIEEFINENRLMSLAPSLKGGKLRRLRINPTQIKSLAASAMVAYIDLISPPDEPLNHENRVIQRNNILNNPVAGLGLSGEGVCVGIGDGGQLGEHIDFAGRVINKANGTYASYGSHGDRVSGIIGSAGNLDPRHKGVAPECELITQKTSSIVHNAPQYHQEYNMVLSNNSYGVNSLCKQTGAYNYRSIDLDWQMREYGKMLHVFAAGNGGTNQCNEYPQGFATLLPYSQEAKNVLTVGSVDENRQLAYNSSRGPSFDGRIKPEICGVGVNVTTTGRNNDYWTGSGTSFSSPSVVGSLALLYQAYRALNNDEDPDGALIKAIACNTADDLGNPGPDFSFGYGLINTRRAYRLMENGHYLKAELSHGQVQQHQIQVPAGISQLKLMIYWHDREARSDANRTLVNNLDLKLMDSNNAEWQPWVLDASPSKVTKWATRGIDSVNNIEQITLDHPNSGSFTVEVEGTNIPFGPQDYYLVYEFVYSEVVLTYPYGGEVMVPGAREHIQWDVDPLNTSSFNLAYSLDQGSSWVPIAQNIEANRRSYLWNLPRISAEQVLLRVEKSDGGVSISKSSFSILPTPEIEEMSEVCEGYGQVKWKNVDQQGEKLYEVLSLDERSMRVLGNTSDSSFVFGNSIQTGQKYWYGVRVKTQSNLYSNRSVSEFFVAQAGEVCPWSDDLKLNSIFVPQQLVGRANTSSSLSVKPLKLSVKNLGNNDVSSFELGLNWKDQTLSSEQVNRLIPSGDTIQYQMQSQLDLSQSGKYSLDAWVRLPEDTRRNNDSLIGNIEFIQLANDPVDLPFVQDFAVSNIDVCDQNTIGLQGIENWDFNATARGCLNLTNGFIQLNPSTDPSNHSLEDELILTTNLSKYNLAYGLRMNLGHFNADNPENVKLWARGSDADSWVEIMTLPVSQGVDWDTMQYIDLSTPLLNHGQELSSSFQIRINRKGQHPWYVNHLKLEPVLSLPVELSFFKATRQGNGVLLEWETLSEVNNSHFLIELARSEEDLLKDNFEVIAKVQGQGNSSKVKHYQFLDNSPGKTGIRYYRLKQVDFDGQFSFSSIDSVKFGLRDLQINLYPNPFERGVVLDLVGEQAALLKIDLMDSIGRSVARAEFEVVQGYNNFSLEDITQNLPKGMYILQIQLGQTLQYLKLNKQ